MAVRKTESRIPGGFTQQNADGLGQATVFVDPVSTDPYYALIAYFSGPIRRGADLPFRNRYVAFVNTARVPQSTADAIGYKWTIVFKSNSVQVFTYTGANSPVFNVDAAQIPNSGAINTAQTCEVTLEILNSGAQTPPKLILTHSTLTNPRQEIETGSVNPLLNYTYYNNVKTTRKVANTLDEYLRNSNQVLGKKLDVPVELPAAVLYGNVMPGFGEWKEDLIFEKLVNDPNAKPVFYAYAPTRIGACGIKPHFLALALPKPTAATTPYLTTAQPATPTYFLTTPATNEEAVYTAFANLSKDDQVDIYNLLRFPKSGVKMCAVLADYIRKAWYPAASAGELKKSKTYLKSVITQMEIGLQGATVFKVTAAAARIATMVNSNAIREILTTSAPLVDYKVITIRVLDVRSGRPVTNARVKRLVITSTLGMVANTIGRNRIDTAGTIVDQNYLFAPTSVLTEVIDPAKKAQKALHELGFAVVPNTQNGSSFTSNAQAIAQYSNYWQSRLLNNSVPALTATSLLATYEDYLDLIVEEYKAHSQTDDNGILKVRLPVNLLQNRGITIEVGFYEFPVATECIRSEIAAGAKLSRTLDAGQTVPKETETKFEVSWIGNQDLTWQPTAGNLHFGWTANQGATSANFKVNQVLTLSDTAAGNQIVLDPNQLSRFYHDTDYPYHFVLFGMVWCQPVWEPLPATVTHLIKGGLDRATSNPNGLFRTIATSDHATRSLPVICTRWNTGDSKAGNSGSDGGGRDYGTFFTNGSYWPRGSGVPHQGIDYHAREGVTPVFAPHGGKVIETRSYNDNTESSGYGEKVVIKFSHITGKGQAVLLAHMHRQPSIITAVTQGHIVMAGRLIGKAGRTFNKGGNVFYRSGPTHLHFEAIDNKENEAFVVGDTRYSDARNMLPPADIANRALFLFNDSDRIFPCDAHYPLAADWPSSDLDHQDAALWTVSNCLIRVNGGNVNPAKFCWASRNLHCPYLGSNTNKIFLYQAQLTYHANTSKNTGLDPKGITGQWNVGSGDAIKTFRQKYRTEIYTGSVPEPTTDAQWKAAPASTDPDLTIARLNYYAPYPRTTTSRPDR